MSVEATSEASSEEESWISWYCSIRGNEYFCEVDRRYIEDNFNLFGLKPYFGKTYNVALDTILDRIGSEASEFMDDASRLYGLIHARYIVTNLGFDAMYKKYMRKEFGECPRYQCHGQAALPLGLYNEPGICSVKLFCPLCQDVFNCPPCYQNCDGAFFGTTFPHLFFLNFEQLVPRRPRSTPYVPKVFGFRIHSSSKSLPQFLNSPVEDESVKALNLVRSLQRPGVAGYETSDNESKLSDAFTQTSLQQLRNVSQRLNTFPPMGTLNMISAPAGVVGSQGMNSNNQFTANFSMQNRPRSNIPPNHPLSSIMNAAGAIGSSSTSYPPSHAYSFFQDLGNFFPQSPAQNAQLYQHQASSDPSSPFASLSSPYSTLPPQQAQIPIKQEKDLSPSPKKRPRT